MPRCFAYCRQRRSRQPSLKEKAYRERIMPPAGTVLIVSLEDSARADAPSTELVAFRMRLAGEPPYRWRLDCDERLVDSTSRPVEFTHFNRHLLRSKLNWMVSHEGSQIPSRKS